MVKLPSLMVGMILPPPRIPPGLVMTAISTMLRPAASAAQGVAVSGGQVRGRRFESWQGYRRDIK